MTYYCSITLAKHGVLPWHKICAGLYRPALQVLHVINTIVCVLSTSTFWRLVANVSDLFKAKLTFLNILLYFLFYFPLLRWSEYEAKFASPEAEILSQVAAGGSAQLCRPQSASLLSTRAPPTAREQTFSYSTQNRNKPLLKLSSLGTWQQEEPDSESHL